MPPTDDPSIADETKLHRGIATQHVIPDQNHDRLRISSAAFNHGETSVLLGDALAASGRSPSEALEGMRQEFLASLRAWFVREHGQIVVRSPLETEVAHGDVIGRKTKAISRAFARTAAWEVPPSVDFEPPSGPR